jgi:hypothetical protein
LLGSYSFCSVELWWRSFSRTEAALTFLCVNKVGNKSLQENRLPSLIPVKSVIG